MMMTMMMMMMTMIMTLLDNTITGKTSSSHLTVQFEHGQDGKLPKMTSSFLKKHRAQQKIIFLD